MLFFNSRQNVTRDFALRLMGISGGVGAVLGAAGALLNREEGESAGDTSRRVFVEAGRGTALGLAGGLGALAYAPLAPHVERAFSGVTPLGRVSCSAVGDSIQGALIGAAIGGYRALVPQNDRWAQQPLRQRARTFMPADTKSWATTGLFVGLVSHALGYR